MILQALGSFHLPKADGFQGPAQGLIPDGHKGRKRLMGLVLSCMDGHRSQKAFQAGTPFRMAIHLLQP